MTISLCHFFIPSVARSLHPHFLCFLTLPFALPQVLNYFQTPRQGIAGHRGPFGLSTLKNSWFETTTAHLDDSMIWLSSAWSSFVLFCFSTRLTFIPPDDWHWSILESFSCRTLIPLTSGSWPLKEQVIFMNMSKIISVLFSHVAICKLACWY